MPTTYAGWKALPGVGDYTAAAVSSIANGEAMPSVDGNTVNVHHEQAAFARNNIELQASLQFLSGKIRGTLTAIKGE